MPDANKPGLTFKGSVYHDAFSLMLSSTNGISIAKPTDFAVADPINPNAEIRADTGIVEMGPADGLWLLPGGTDADGETYSLFATGYSPIVADGLIIGWIGAPIMGSVVTLGANTQGAVAALLDGVTSTGLTAKSIVPTGQPNALTYRDETGVSPTLRPTSPSNIGRVGVLFPTFGCPFVHLQVVLGTAASAIVLGKRVSGMFGGQNV